MLASVERIGVPALVKASAGGGGKGMRDVRSLAEAVTSLQAARREAVTAFGDGTLYVERLLDRPRHVEVQIFADGLGNVVHLFERECSTQRRHQKVIEESPSPSITPGLRARMTAAAVAVARAANYRNAGTIEFLVDGQGDDARFYFLEMNTRLQVEHGVTEAVTGVDLVRAQLLVAGGDGLPWTQESLTQRGHAIEARVYAEDPAREFLPQAGPLLLYREPRIPNIRIDSGVVEGGEIPVHYDPMIAKVIASGETREVARTRLGMALRDYPILGVLTNIPFLLAVLSHPAFEAGSVDTGFLDREGAALVGSVPTSLPGFIAEAIPAMDAFARSTTADLYPPTSDLKPLTSDLKPPDPWTALRKLALMSDRSNRQGPESAPAYSASNMMEEAISCTRQDAAQSDGCSGTATSSTPVRQRRAPREPREPRRNPGNPVNPDLANARAGRAGARPPGRQRQKRRYPRAA